MDRTISGILDQQTGRFGKFPAKRQSGKGFIRYPESPSCILQGNQKENEIGTLVIEKTFNCPVERVWQALTDKEQMKEWYFDIEDFKPELGFEFQFVGGREGVLYLHLCKITELIPFKKISYSWSYMGFKGNSRVSFELFPENGGTRLRLTHEGLDTLPMFDPNFLNGYYVPDWEGIIGNSLAAFLGSRSPHPSPNMKATQGT